MRFTKKLSKLMIIIAFISSGEMDMLYGQVKFVNEFLNIGVGARAQGMFNSVVASSNDATSAYWNPANLTRIKAPVQISAMHANWFGSIANYDYATIAKRINKEKNSYAAFTFIRLGIDNIPNTLNLVGPDGSIDFDRVTTFSASDYAGLLSYGTSIRSNLDFGGSVKVIHRTIGSFGSSWGFGADLGMTYRAKHFTVGLMTRDITTTFNAWSFSLKEEERNVFLASGNSVPISSTEITLPRVIVGLAHKNSFSNFSFLIESNLNFSSNGTKASVFSANRFNIDPTAGIEIGYGKLVYLRAGIGNLQRLINESNTSTVSTFDFQPNVGLGLVLGRIKIDYALANIGNVSSVAASHIFSVNLDFKEPSKEK
jgi:hypothetical protein